MKYVRTLSMMAVLFFIGSLACDNGGEQEMDTTLLKAPKDYINIERSAVPFADVLRQIGALLVVTDGVPQLRELLDLMAQGRKAFSKKLLKEALTQAAEVFVQNQQVLAGRGEWDALAERLASCLAFLEEEPAQEQAVNAVCACCAAEASGSVAVSCAS